ncbi:MAG TPA: hypothetical protein VK469_05655 [Candidatus Kapabacteria bacterium]|nr:hypothetical protein [Candidatus Kapabacteria bacterium]
MARTNKTIENYLYREGLTLQSSKTDTLIRAQVGIYGYNDSRFEEGITKHGIVNTLNQKLMGSRGEQLKLAILVKDQFTERLRKYSHFIGILSSHFSRNKEIIKELAMDDKIRRTIPSFAPRALNFYTGIMNKPHLLEAVAIFELTPEKLQEEIDKIMELLELHKEHRILIGENQRLTEERNIKLADFKQFMNQYKGVLFMLFEKENPQILERINVFVRNAPKPQANPINPDPVPTPVTSSGNTTRDTSAASAKNMTMEPVKTPATVETPKATETIGTAQIPTV